MGSRSFGTGRPIEDMEEGEKMLLHSPSDLDRHEFLLINLIST